MPARRTASATTSAPSCVAVKPFSAPRNLPVGVRTADDDDGFTHRADSRFDRASTTRRAEQRLQAPQDHRRRAHHFLRPLRAGGLHQQHACLELDVGDALDRRADGGLPRERHLAVRQRRAAQQLDERAGHAVSEGLHRPSILSLQRCVLDPRVLCHRVASSLACVARSSCTRRRLRHSTWRARAVDRDERGAPANRRRLYVRRLAAEKSGGTRIA